MSVEFLTLTEREKFAYCPVPPPKDPWHDWRWWSLIVPCVATAFGLFAFSIFAVGFSQLRDLPEGIKFIIVAFGAICIPFGSELGTVSSIIEIFRKHFGPGGATKLDWTGLIVSTCTSVSGLILSWAYLLATDTAWSNDVKTWGPLVFGALMVVDFTCSMIETGSYLGSYDRRFHEWYRKDFTPWIKKKEKQLDDAGNQEYNWGAGLTQWPEEPPVKKDDTPIRKPDFSDVVLVDYGGNGGSVPTTKLDSGEVQIEDIEYLHPAVARSILSDD